MASTGELSYMGSYHHTWWLDSERKSRIFMFVESSLFDFLMKKQQLCHNKYELWSFMVATALLLST